MTQLFLGSTLGDEGNEALPVIPDEHLAEVKEECGDEAEEAAEHQALGKLKRNQLRLLLIR